MEKQINSGRRTSGGPPRISEKVTFKHDLEGDVFETPIRASIREVEHGKHGTISLDELGAPKEFQENSESRYLWVCRKTGAPIFIERPTLEAARTVIQGKLLSYTVFQDSDLGFRMIAIGCENKTFYLVQNADCRPARIIAFAPSEHARHAVRELLQMSLYRGPNPYDRIATLVPGFFKRAVKTVYNMRTMLTLKTYTIRGRDTGENFTARVYLLPGNPKGTIISVDGWCFDYDLNHYPKWQQIMVERYNDRAKIRRQAIRVSKKKQQAECKQAVSI